MATNLAPPPPINITNKTKLDKQELSTAYANASMWNNWYTQLQTIINKINKSLAGFVTPDQYGKIPVGVDSPTDLIVNDEFHGLVLKDTNLHYWRITMNTDGTLAIVDLGVTKPTT